jgi:thiol-disulfide isomerase/thioredoxin
MIKELLYLIMLIGSATLANSQSPGRRAPVGGSQKIPKWKIEDVVRSFSVNNDTVYVVNFWATFCKPCNEEIPDFIRLAEKYKKQKVKLLLVSLDLPSYVPVRLPEFIKKNKYNTNHVWLNETDADRFCPMIDEKWSGAIPATIIVNNKTGYRKFFDDQVSSDDFEVALKAATGETAIIKYPSPMNNAELIDNKSVSIDTDVDAGMNNRLTFKSMDSTVFSIAAGKVTTIVRIENFKVLIIQDGKMFYTYSNLGSTILKKGDNVKQHQLIGYATNELFGEIPTLELYINDETGKNIPLTKENFITKKDKRLTDHSIEIDTKLEPQ